MDKDGTAARAGAGRAGSTAPIPVTTPAQASATTRSGSVSVPAAGTRPAPAGTAPASTAPVAGLLGVVGGAVVVPVRAGPLVALPGPEGRPEGLDGFPDVEPPEVGRDGVGSVATGVAP